MLPALVLLPALGIGILLLDVMDLVWLEAEALDRGTSESKEAE